MNQSGNNKFNQSKLNRAAVVTTFPRFTPVSRVSFPAPAIRYMSCFPRLVTVQKSLENCFKLNPNIVYTVD